MRWTPCYRRRVPAAIDIHVAAHSDPATGRRRGEAARTARECGVEGQALSDALGQLTAIGPFERWWLCPDTGEMQWRYTSRHT